MYVFLSFQHCHPNFWMNLSKKIALCPQRRTVTVSFFLYTTILPFFFKYFFNLRNPNGKCSQTNLKPSIACDILVELIFILGKKENQLCCIISNNLLYFSILLNYWDYSLYTANFDSTP